eukprot:CAMPEP_0118660348 /NCGR_PEP_ID=MMETSP0785-20121206/15628_1 /TAXON_ID=91992 /ORGANISM="Bolidomonas pacifica, Strain CCMP 1866" /LENGTH=171 /DNA_ID=CAMNT_0006553575 /DNA_START=88 /DNA_END=600 /DNA_ORIENTATION=-
MSLTPSSSSPTSPTPTPPTPTSPTPSYTVANSDYDPFSYSSGLPFRPPPPPTSATGFDQHFAIQPTACDGKVVFVSEGDLFLASTSSASPIPAVRLTTGLGNELHPLLSPSCTTVAFTATYSGHRELYVMPITVGDVGQDGITRLTYTDNTSGVTGVLSWSADSSSVTFTT